MQVGRADQRCLTIKRLDFLSKIAHTLKSRRQEEAAAAAHLKLGSKSPSMLLITHTSPTGAR